MSDRSLPDDLDRVDQALRERLSWYPVAKKEFKDAIRSNGLLFLSVVFTVFFVMPAAGALYFDLNLTRQGQELGMQLLISQGYTNVVTLFVPIVAIFAGYAAITKERTSGSLKLLLSLPHSRKDVIVGKVVGRSITVAVPLIAALVLTALFLVVSELSFKPELFAMFSLYTLGFAVVFVAIAVSISGAVKKSLYAALANFLAYFYFTFTWNLLANEFGKLLANDLGVTGTLRWNIVLFAKLVNPSQAYKTLIRSMTNEGAGATLRARYSMFSQSPEDMKTICGDVLQGNATTVEGPFGPRAVCEEGARTLPVYFSDPAVFLYIFLWIGLAALLSYYTFNLVDL